MDSVEFSKNRNRNKPKRYGMAEMNLSGQSEESEEPYNDNSLDDETYSPHSAEQKNTSSQSDESSVGNSSDMIMDFNQQFETIEKNPEVKSPAIPSDQSHTVAKCLPEKSEESSFQLEVLNQLKILNNRSIEMAMRIGVIEESLIKNGRLISIKKEAEANNEFSLFDDYAKLKKFPCKTVAEFKVYENSLKAENMIEAVRIFITANSILLYFEINC